MATVDKGLASAQLDEGKRMNVEQIGVDTQETSLSGGGSECEPGRKVEETAERVIGGEAFQAVCQRTTEGRTAADVSHGITAEESGEKKRSSEQRPVCLRLYY